jgi:UDP-N-acetylmuramyl tripeptide synthase
VTPDDPILFDEVWLNGRLEQNFDAVYGDEANRSTFVTTDPAAPLTYTKLKLARAAGRVSRASGRGGGTTAPGRLLLRLAPGAIGTMAKRLRHGVALISATNGKTTTARMLASILEADGRAVVHNRAGANTHWGVCTALAEGDGDFGVFEVDEAWLPLLAAELCAETIVLINLARDRLDSYGELERLVSLWRGLLRGPAAPATVVANADDPLLAGPGGVLDGARCRSLLFGVEDLGIAAASPDQPHDAHSCAACGHRLSYSGAFLGHLGHYRCVSCGRTRPTPMVRALSVRAHGLQGTTMTLSIGGSPVDVRLTQPGVHNVYNAIAAAGAAAALGVEREAIRIGLESARPAFGRSETITVQRRPVHIFLVKNPAGVNATIRVLAADPRRDQLHLWMALNDGWADGRDVSWIWDADFERISGLVAAVTCSGRRARELALRLKYAGLNCEIDTDEDIDASFHRALRRAPGALIAMPTYTALLRLRGVLNRQGLPVTDWGTAARSAP